MTRRATATIALLIAGASVLFFASNRRGPAPPVLSVYRIKADHEPFGFRDQHDRKTTSFRIDWPPMAPTDGRKQRSPPLLLGKLIVSTGEQSSEPKINIRIEVSRTGSEENRMRWNRNLKFPEYDWMSRVRTWDREHKWLWPNLPYLLRAHGLQREQRYGGVDPDKSVDNDFAALVVKPAGAGEYARALITAEWNAPLGGFVDKRSVVHRALSDDLQIALPNSERRGKLDVWLIYADFLEFIPPASWPLQPEFDGGILSYFSIEWQADDSGMVKIQKAENTVPPSSTGVDWKSWLSSNQGTGISDVPRESLPE